LDERRAIAVPAKAGPCFVHDRRSSVVATISVPTLPSKPVYRQTQPPSGEATTRGSSHPPAPSHASQRSSPGAITGSGSTVKRSPSSLVARPMRDTPA
jgi:hypothetical protein